MKEWPGTDITSSRGIFAQQGSSFRQEIAITARKIVRAIRGVQAMGKHARFFCDAFTAVRRSIRGTDVHHAESRYVKFPVGTVV